MQLMRYREELLAGARPALVMTEKQHMTPLATNERRARASWRRMARKRGTSRAIRDFLKENL